MRPLLFDSHLDLAWNALSWKRDLLLPLEALNAIDARMDDHKARGRATVCLPSMRKAGLAVCLGTLMGRVPYGETTPLHGSSLDFPCHENAYAFACGQWAYYDLLGQLGHLRWIRTAQDLQRHWHEWLEVSGSDLQQVPPACHTSTLTAQAHTPTPDSRGPVAPPLGLILAMEGCDAICTPAQAEDWYRRGLRCASLVHYGRSQYASGTGDEGPVSPLGLELLREFDRLGMILDTTHLCDTSFDQALDAFSGPVLASHQNCRALVPGQRQFDDRQIRRLVERGGILGIAYDAWMLVPGWIRGQTSPEVVSLAASVDHIDHICQLSGSDRHVALGSDLDGGFGTEQTPRDLRSIDDLRRLIDLLAARGYSSDSIERILGENWYAFFCQHLEQEPA